MQQVTIILRHPHRLLSPNATVGSIRGRMAKSRVTKEYRQQARLLTNAQLLCSRPMWTTARTSIVWYSRTRTRPDADNALSSLKAAFDGMKDAGLLADDRELGHEPIRFEVDKHNPRVEVTVTRVSA